MSFECLFVVELCISSDETYSDAAVSVCRPNGVYDIADNGGKGCGWGGRLVAQMLPGSAAGACSKRRRAAVKLDIVRGQVVSEARQEFGEWATLITR